MYVAQDSRDGQRVAIKLSSLSELDAIKNEIALQRLSVHENVVAYKETFSDGTNLWVRGTRIEFSV